MESPFENAANQYENTTRLGHLLCPRCEGRGVTCPVSTRTLPCTRCYNTGEDLVGSLATWEADLIDLRLEWERYSKLVAQARGGRRFGLSKKLEGLEKRGRALLEKVRGLRAEIDMFKAVAPF